MKSILVSRSTALFVMTLAAFLGNAPHTVAAGVDTFPPELTILSPILSTNVQFRRTSSFEIYGEAFDDVGLGTLRVRTGTSSTGYSLLTNINLSGRHATWSTTVTLTEGSNYFLIQVTDAAGRSACNFASPTASISCGQVYAVFSTNAARNPFEAWQVANFTLAELLDASASGENADPDGDGVRNFVEYGAGMNPKDASRQGLPTASLENSFLTMAYVHATNATDATNMVLVSSNLNTWNSGSNYSALISTQDLGATIRFKTRMTQPVTSAPAGFLRLDVQKVPPTRFPDVVPILLARCDTCHLPGGSSGSPWFDGDIYKHLVGRPSLFRENVPLVFPGFPEYSDLYRRITSTNSTYRMPSEQPPLLVGQIEIIRKWIQDGALP